MSGERVGGVESVLIGRRLRECSADFEGDDCGLRLAGVAEEARLSPAGAEELEKTRQVLRGCRGRQDVDRCPVGQQVIGLVRTHP